MWHLYLLGDQTAFKKDQTILRDEFTATLGNTASENVTEPQLLNGDKRDVRVAMRQDCTRAMHVADRIE